MKTFTLLTLSVLVGYSTVAYANCPDFSGVYQTGEGAQRLTITIQQAGCDRLDLVRQWQGQEQMPAMIIPDFVSRPVYENWDWVEVEVAGWQGPELVMTRQKVWKFTGESHGFVSRLSADAAGNLFERTDILVNGAILSTSTASYQKKR